MGFHENRWRDRRPGSHRNGRIGEVHTPKVSLLSHQIPGEQNGTCSENCLHHLQPIEPGSGTPLEGLCSLKVLKRKSVDFKEPLSEPAYSSNELESGRQPVPNRRLAFAFVMR